MLGRLSHKWSIQLTRRLVDPSGNFAGIVAISLDPTFLARKFASINVGMRGSVSLLGSDGLLRARAPELSGMFERNLKQVPAVDAPCRTSSRTRSRS